MREEETPKTEQQTDNLPGNSAHPWVDLPEEDDSIGEAVRCSLDEIRYA